MDYWWRYNHSGTTFAETSYFFGAYEPLDYGCQRFGVPEAQSAYIKHYWQGGAELSFIMLQAWSHSGNISGNISSGGRGGVKGSAVALLQDTVLPWVESMVRFYDEHYPKYANGTLWLKDAQVWQLRRS